LPRPRSASDEYLTIIARAPGRDQTWRIVDDPVLGQVVALVRRALDHTVVPGGAHGDDLDGEDQSARDVIATAKRVGRHDQDVRLKYQAGLELHVEGRRKQLAQSVREEVRAEELRRAADDPLMHPSSPTG